jgi:hypothetical protein
LPTEELDEIAADLHCNLTGKLVLGFPLGPFILVLRPDNLDIFDEFLDIAPSVIDVDIGFASSDGE